jgi:DNA-binding SARP family transcriptional activator/class 3 adenylate cyclase/tetratricopeptide (TPR) repeat protein
VEFRILGPFEVLEDRQPVSLPRGQGRTLLAILVLRAGEVVSADRLIDELWGETPPATATNALQNLVSRLRKRLKPARAGGVPPVLETHQPGYRLAIDPGQVDSNRFRLLLAEASEAPVREKAAMLHRALSLWRGPALADFIYEPFAQAEIAELEELRLTAAEERIDADLAIGRHTKVVAELQGLASEHPLRERLAEQLMLALYRSGRQVEALEVYTGTRRTLIDELGIEPGLSLRQLEGSILRQDADLDLKPAPREPTSEPFQPTSTTAFDPWIPEERKTVTVMFVDVTVSTSSGLAPDDESVHQLMARFFGMAAAVLVGHGGSVEEVVGGAIVGVFGIPRAREDDALRAVRAAIDLRHALSAMNRELANDGEVRLAARAGINTGEVVVGERGSGKTIASGAAVKAAARLQQAAAEGEILVGEGTRWLVQNATVLRSVASAAVVGLEAAPTAWKLLDLVPGAPPFARRRDTPIVGRAAELSQLRAAYDWTVRRRTARRFTVLGEAGIGKSRLAREFGTELGPEAWVLTGRCPAYGDGITFWPLREVVFQAAGSVRRDALLDVLGSTDDADSIADQVAGAIGSAETSGRPDELFPALRRFFEALARERPVAVILEDIHWAQPTLLDLVDFLADGTSAPVFLLCLARPELLELRGAWSGGPSAGSMVLDPLEARDSEQLIADRLGGRPIPGEILAHILQTAQGNPLFAEQMLASVGEEGPFSIPASVQALLAARLDRLGPAERDLLRSASVLGTEFSLAALMPLLPAEARAFAVRHLETLERKELILRSRSSPLAEETFGFRHDLIRLAAYRSMTKATRAELHEWVAHWLEDGADQGRSEFEELIGYHLEQAHRFRRELGLHDAQTRTLGVRAGEQLASAGLRAFARFDAAAAENLLSRARALLPHDHPLGSKLVRNLAEAHAVMGRHADADGLLSELLEEVRVSEDIGLEHFIRLERARILLATGPDPTSLDAIRDEAERALKVFEADGNEAGLSHACHVLGLVHQRLGELSEMEQVARRGLAHAERSGNAREELGARWTVSMALVAGATPVKSCIRTCRELVRWRGTENPGVLADLAVLQSMLGEVDEARQLIIRARRLLVERTRARRPLGAVARRAAEVEIIAGDLAAGERELSTAIELGREMGERDQVSQIAASLSRILSAQGATEKAAKFASLSEDDAPAESVTAQALWRAATARALAHRDDSQRAERLAREAIQLLPLEMLNLGADIRLDLAEVLLASGQRDAATKAINEAIDLYGRKGNLAAVIHARSLARGRRDAPAAS